jgi:hypothetical protein
MASAPDRLPMRSPNLADLLIVILATGCGLAAVRDKLPDLFAAPQVPGGGWATPIYLSRIVAIEPLLMAWSLAWLALQVRRPRPILRRLARGPGFRAGVASAVVLLTSGPLCYFLIRSGSSGSNPEMEQLAWSEVVSAQVGLGVLISWTILRMEARWRTAGWLDRGGTGVGGAWICLIPVNAIHLFWYNGWL